MFLLWQVLCGGKVAAMLQACALGSAWKHLRLRLECMTDNGVSPGNHGDSVVLLGRKEHFVPLVPNPEVLAVCASKHAETFVC